MARVTSAGRVWQVATLALMCLFSQAASAATAGRIYFVSGEAYVERGSERFPAQKDTRLQAGDVIETGDTGRVQWRMVDDSYFAIRPNSRFKIDEFQRPANGSGGKAFYSLLKGGFRSITGLVGKSDQASYRVQSTVATMGIRGTDHTHILCQGDCGWAPGGNVKDGLYSRVDAGISVLANNEGSLDLQAGQYGLTASPPAQLPAMPAVFATWAFDFAIDFGAGDLGIQSEGSLRIEPLGNTGGNICIPVPSPNQPCP
jgi:hypothetical protein